MSVLTFDWHSIRPVTLKRMPKSETFVMLITVVVMVMFARRVAHFVSVTRRIDKDEQVSTVRYTVDGELFFASSNDLTTQFEYTHDPDRVIIDMSRSHVWDASTVAALDAIATKYERHGKRVILEGMNDATTQMYARLSGGLGAEH